MLDIIAPLCILSATGLLVALSIIDLKHWILPDELNFALGVTGALFHFATAYRFADITTLLLGAALGAGILYAIRFFANRHYGRDTLGLGDVKLLAAAGFWLGMDGILMAVTFGALAGLIHGAGVALYMRLVKKEPVALGTLSIPAGPGFAVGIFGSGVYMFHAYVTEVIHGLFT